jgi:hypothetical protein
MQAERLTRLGAVLAVMVLTGALMGAQRPVNRGRPTTRGSAANADSAAATQPARPGPGEWISVGDDAREDARARAFFGVWVGKDERPGHAARVVRRLPGEKEEHFGITLALALPADYTGEMHYREVLALPAKPKTWDRLNRALRELTVARTISADGRSATITETLYFAGGERILPLDGGDVENLPTPFVIWDFAEGDPPGDWTMECWLNEKYLGNFAFKVVEGRRADKEPIIEMDREMERFRPAKLGRMVLP